jgi:hypothetical protein
VLGTSLTQVCMYSGQPWPCVLMRACPALLLLLLLVAVLDTPQAKEASLSAADQSYLYRVGAALQLVGVVPKDWKYSGAPSPTPQHLSVCPVACSLSPGEADDHAVPISPAFTKYVAGHAERRADATCLPTHPRVCVCGVLVCLRVCVGVRMCVRVRACVFAVLQLICAQGLSPRTRHKASRLAAPAMAMLSTTAALSEQAVVVVREARGIHPPARSRMSVAVVARMVDALRR